MSDSTLRTTWGLGESRRLASRLGMRSSCLRERGEEAEAVDREEERAEEIDHNESREKWSER